MSLVSRHACALGARRRVFPQVAFPVGRFVVDVERSSAQASRGSSACRPDSCHDAKGRPLRVCAIVQTLKPGNCGGPFVQRRSPDHRDIPLTR